MTKPKPTPTDTTSTNVSRRTPKAKGKAPAKAKAAHKAKGGGWHLVPIAALKANPTNPRVLRDEKFAKLKASLQSFPDMLNKRPIVAVTDKDGKFMVLGGNMRLRACQDLGVKEVPVILADEWTEEQRREFIIKDNVGFGEWDWDQLANEWDAGELADWGLDFPGAEIASIDAPELADGPKPEYQQMTFTLHDSQAETVKAAMDKAKAEGAAESDVNENSNGNALAYLAASFING